MVPGQLRVSWLGSTGGLGRDMPWSGTVTVLLSVSPVVAQRLRKLDFPVKDSEEPSVPGVDKNLFLRPRVPGEDTGKVSAPETWGQSPVLSGLRGASRACCCHREGIAARRAEKQFPAHWPGESLSGGCRVYFKVLLCFTAFVKGWSSPEVSHSCGLRSLESSSD